MTPQVDQAELRTAITNTPAETRTKLMEWYKAGEYPSLDPDVHTWEADALLDVAAQLQAIAAEATPPYALRIPLDTAPLRERIMALPDDLADMAALDAKAALDGAGIPNVAHPSRWTLEHWYAADDIIGHAEELAAARLRYVHAALGSVPATDVLSGETILIDPDAWRHTVVGCVTDGRTESSRKLTGPEAEHLARWAEASSLGTVTGPPPAFVPDWPAAAKRLGLTQADLNKASKEWHKVRRLEAPKKLSEITDHRAIAHLIGTALDGRTASVAAAEHVDQVAPAMQAEVVAELKTMTAPAAPVTLAPFTMSATAPVVTRTNDDAHPHVDVEGFTEEQYADIGRMVVAAERRRRELDDMLRGLKFISLEPVPA